MENFETKSHAEELESIFNNENEEIDNAILNTTDYSTDLKVFFRLIRKKYSAFIRNKMQKNFVNIVYLTLDCPDYTSNSSRIDSPLEFIDEMRKQYPDNNISVLIPIINTTEQPAKPLFKFDFFIQNENQEGYVYKLGKNKFNISVYGIYSPSFSGCVNPNEASKLQYLAPFLKAVRCAIKKMNFDIVHSENIPFYLGKEFSHNSILTNTKVLQTIKDFTQINLAKSELFWAAINLADKKSMKKICSDEVIKKLIASLFKLHNTKRLYQMRDCLKFIYQNYYKFRKYVDKGDDLEENVIFHHLNQRIAQLFWGTCSADEQYLNPYIYTIKHANWWVTTSKTYYKDIFENQNLSGKMFKLLEKTKNKSSYVSYGINLNNYPKENTREIYHEFNIENFRERRSLNKVALLKEFDQERIKTNFTDVTLFKGENVKIYGYLDSFYESPLLFANPSSDIYSNGIDVMFNTILKLFELHKNIQIIISINNGMKTNFIKSWVEFLQKNKSLDGRWVFIDGEINLPKFLAGSDMILLPRRMNLTSPKHFLAMHYGCVPIASKCGILNDTIPDIFDDISNGCGFKTKTNLLTEDDNNELFLSPVMKALSIYQNNPSSWTLLVKNCLNKNPKWNFKILEKYNNIYQELI
jgi:hypothetical protein